MKKRIITTTLTLTLAALLLASCGGNTDDGKEADTNDSVVVTDTTLPETDAFGETVETTIATAIRINGVDISEFSIVCADDKDETKLISDYVIENVKLVSGIDLKVSDLSETDGKIIEIAASEGDEFEIKVENGNIYITYSAVDGAYKAVATTLGDSLFDTASAKNGSIDLENGFSVSGKCSDYVIGDNEFNPFA